MKMRTFAQKKLWRNKAVTMCESNGSLIHWRRLADEEYDHELRIKLLEESDEVRVAKTRHELISELADVYEAIDSLCILHDIDRDEILRVQNAKNDARGSFSERKYVEIAEHPIGSAMEQYCLNAPDKYPEMIEKDISWAIRQ